MSHRIATTTLPTGVEVEYIENGSPGGTPLLLLHGLSDSWHSFLPLLPHLPRSVWALAFSQRGHGRSGKPRGDYGLDVLVADAVAFLDAMHIERAVIAGHSMGAAVASLLAAEHPDRVAGAALLGAFADFRRNSGAIELQHDVRDLTDPVDPDFARAFQVSTIARMIDDEFIDLVVADSQALPSHAWRSLLDGFMRADLPAAFRRIDAPVALVWGDSDAFVPREEQDAMLRAIHSAELHAFDDTGHAVHWDRPGETAGVLEALVRSAAGRLAA